jgi:HAD superfamily hydrolase (TIGR01493 family)
VTTPARRAHPALAAVIFDLGGTLIYPTTTQDDNLASFDRWRETRRLPHDLTAALRDARQWMWEQTAATGRQYTTQEAVHRAYDGLGLPAPDQATVEAAEQAFFAAELAGYQAFPESLALLRRLRAARIRTGCISNASSHWLIERIVEQMGFAAYLDAVVSSAGYGRVKPDPGIFRGVLARWGMPPERVAMVGDTLAADIAGGRGLGMRTICVTMVPAPWNADHRHIVADAVAPTLRHVERVLLGWARPG